MVEGRVPILRLNFSFSVQNFIELYNRNVKSSRKHDRSQWTRCNGGIPHVPQRYTKKRDAEKCNLKQSAHWIFNLVDSCWPGFPLRVVHNGGSGGVSVWKESARASFDGIRQCGAMLPRPAVPGHQRQNAPHNGIICRINFKPYKFTAGERETLALRDPCKKPPLLRLQAWKILWEMTYSKNRLHSVNLFVLLCASTYCTRHAIKKT